MKVNPERRAYIEIKKENSCADRAGASACSASAGTSESQTRYAMLLEQISNGAMDMDGVRDALDSVSKHNFDSPFASTEWSIVYDKVSGAVRYYHRENYDHVYSFELAG